MLGTQVVWMMGGSSDAPVDTELAMRLGRNELSDGCRSSGAVYRQRLRTALQQACVMAVVLGSATAVRGDFILYLERSSEWKYLPGTQEASSPDPTAWRQPEFDDSTWLSGALPIGYGTAVTVTTDLATAEPPMRGNYSSVFLRSEFFIRDVEEVTELTLSARFDDGLLLWINGVEAVRERVAGEPGDFVAFDSVSNSTHPPRSFRNFVISDAAAMLVPGRNVIAAQGFNFSPTSNDYYLDVEIFDPLGPDQTPPTITQIIPTPLAVLKSLESIDIVFDEPVQGVDATDLLLGDVPASSVTRLAGDEEAYRFAFPSLPAGTVHVTWSSDHDITDAVRRPNSFVPDGDGWTYEVDPNRPAPNIVFTEVLAANGVGLLDSDGDNEDWFELRNLSSFAVDLGGWTVTDSADAEKWRFPGFLLGAGERLVVFASRKDRSRFGEELHTNFSLEKNGETLRLFDTESPRTLVSEFEFPAQRADYSYGVAQDGQIGYFATATPGEQNAATIDLHGFTRPPRFSVKRSFQTEPFELTLSTLEPNATLYFTTDGTTPGPENGEVYTDRVRVEPLADRSIAMVRAAVYKDGLIPSEVVTHSYVFADRVFRQPKVPAGMPDPWKGTTSDYEVDPDVVDPNPELAWEGLMALPTVSVVTHDVHLFDPATGIYQNPSSSGLAWERPTSVEFIDPLQGEVGFQANCGIRIQGGSSTGGWKSKKVSMRLLFKNRYGPSRLTYKLYADSPVREFDALVLDAGLNLTWNHPDHGQRIRAQYIRDQFVSDLQILTDGVAPHGRFVHLFLNGIYWGVYDLHERPDDSFSAAYYGGLKSEYDVLKHTGGNVVEGNAIAWKELRSRLNNGVESSSGYLKVAEMLDVPNLIDYMIVNIFCGNDDWPRHNWYATYRRAPDGRYRFFSWDAEHVLKNASVNQTGVFVSDTPTEFYTRLGINADYRTLFADHIHRHFFNGGVLHVDGGRAWHPSQPEANRPADIYMRRAREVNEAILLESARWGDTRKSPPYSRQDWLNELRWVQNYFRQRSDIVLSQFVRRGYYPPVDAPTFSQHGGEIARETAVTISLPGDTVGDIYYTLDGSDPRTFGTGEVSPSAQLYAGGEIRFDSHGLLKARTLASMESEEGTELVWSALNEAQFIVSGFQPGFIVISEMMYDAQGDENVAGANFEFLELTNPGGTAVDLNGVQFSDGISFAFRAGDMLAPGESIVLVADEPSFRERYPDVEPFGTYTARLSGNGERVELVDGEGEVLFSVNYESSGFWPIGPSGFGYSLVLDAIDSDPDDPRSWRASAELDGSPGAVDPEPAHGGVVVNEVMARGADDVAGNGPGSIELVNFTDREVNVSGWYLSTSRDDLSALAEARVPAATSLPPGGYVVLSTADLGLSLSPTGGELFLSASHPDGSFSGYIAAVSYSAVEAGATVGRHETSTGLEFFPLNSPTLGEANAAPRTPQIAINEVHYHPIEDQDEDEFIELVNTTASPIDISGWELTGINAPNGQDDFFFPNGSIVPASGYLLIVPTDPEIYRVALDIDPAATIVGPFGGQLSNTGERLRLLKPTRDAPEGFTVVDMVRFNDRAPWPESPDGEGSSLERRTATEFGNEVLNWASSKPLGGTPGAINSVSDPALQLGFQVPGDINQDARLNVSDPINLLIYLFKGQAFSLPCGDGTLEAQSNLALMDADGSTTVDLSDPLHMLLYLFRGGAPHAMGGACIPVATCPTTCLREL